jgi:[acyl-carrier-protein] S-malonyltransferase
MNSSNILGLFPGQGSQKVGMGKDLYSTNDIAKDYFDRADKALGFSLSQICFSGPAEELTLTAIAQPAILTLSSICYEIAQTQSNGTLRPSAGAGHSLGEYSALVAAKAITFEDAVQLVNKRGRYMQEAVPPGEGSMAAILGKEVSEIEEKIKEITKGLVEIANINAPGQIVVAGHKTALEELKQLMTGTRIMDLPVSAPFHCKLMKPAEEKLTKDLLATSFNTAQFPIYCNFTAQKTTSPDEIRKNLINQVCGRVRWVESMQNANKEVAPNSVVEFGFGTVLTGLMKRIIPEIARYNADTVDNIQAIISR